MSKYLIANWKQNPESLEEALQIGRELKLAPFRKTQVVICPPSVYLRELSTELQVNFVWGLQDSPAQNSGPYTGEQPLDYLLRSGARHTILGHSERREYLGESDEVINKKLHFALKKNLTPIVCLGGGREAKDPKADVLKILSKQIAGSLAKVSVKSLKAKKLILAYEPPWALSTVSGGKPASAQMVSETIFQIRSMLSEFLKTDGVAQVAVIYGGSVNSDTIGQFLKKPNIDGFLVGGASLNPREFNKIVGLMER